MANSQEIIEAASDADLLDRAIALGIGLGISEQGVRAVFKKIVASDITFNGETTSVAVVYAYAKLTYENIIKNLPPKPGKNLAGVTDELIKLALQAHSHIEV